MREWRACEAEAFLRRQLPGWKRACDSNPSLFGVFSGVGRPGTGVGVEAGEGRARGGNAPDGGGECEESDGGDADVCELRMGRPGMRVGVEAGEERSVGGNAPDCGGGCEESDGGDAGVCVLPPHICFPL